MTAHNKLINRLLDHMQKVKKIYILDTAPVTAVFIQMSNPQLN